MNTPILSLSIGVPVSSILSPGFKLVVPVIVPLKSFKACPVIFPLSSFLLPSTLKLSWFPSVILISPVPVTSAVS